MKILLLFLSAIFSIVPSFAQIINTSEFYYPIPTDTMKFDVHQNWDSLTNENIFYFFLKGTNSYVAKAREIEHKTSTLSFGKEDYTYMEIKKYFTYEYDSVCFFYDHLNRLQSSFNNLGEREDYSYYDSTENINKIRRYANNQLTGLSQEFYLNGHLKKETIFLNGLPEGKCIEYYDNEKVKSIHYHKKGNWTGKMVEYYPSGSKMEIGYIKKGWKVGEWSYFYPNKQLKEIGYLKKEKKIGWWAYYDSTGVLIDMKYFKKGKDQEAPINVGKKLFNLQ